MNCVNRQVGVGFQREVMVGRASFVFSYNIFFCH